MDKFKNVHPIFIPQLETIYKDLPEEVLRDVEFCYYGHIIPQPIKNPEDMLYWMLPDLWCIEYCGMWNQELGCCDFINKGGN